jgi:hypothetical protein
MTRNELLRAIDAHIKRVEISPTAFGTTVMNDPCFVHDLRKGRNVGLDGVERVLSYLKANGPKKTKRKARAKAQ